MRTYHRKTLIQKEGWPKIDDWYWCPLSVVKERVRREAKRFKKMNRQYSLQYSFGIWAEKQIRLDARLAHACDDGRIRALGGWGVQYFTKKNKTVTIYGKCKHCDEELSDGIKGIIIMEREL